MVHRLHDSTLGKFPTQIHKQRVVKSSFLGLGAGLIPDVEMHHYLP